MLNVCFLHLTVFYSIFSSFQFHAIRSPYIPYIVPHSFPSHTYTRTGITSHLTRIVIGWLEYYGFTTCICFHVWSYHVLLLNITAISSHNNVLISSYAPRVRWVGCPPSGEHSIHSIYYTFDTRLSLPVVFC